MSTVNGVEDYFDGEAKEVDDHEAQAEDHELEQEHPAGVEMEDGTNEMEDETNEMEDETNDGVDNGVDVEMHDADDADADAILPALTLGPDAQQVYERPTKERTLEHMKPYIDR